MWVTGSGLLQAIASYGTQMTNGADGWSRKESYGASFGGWVGIVQYRL